MQDAARVFPTERSRTLVVAASSMGTVFEWYDFFLFGALASIIAKHFTAGSDSAGFILRWAHSLPASSSGPSALCSSAASATRSVASAPSC